MPFRQPTPTAIRSYHFRGNAYEFPVESVLEPEQGGGKLLIEASTGYVLTTLTDTEPQSEQALDYVLQPDGSWVASTMVTLLASDSSLVSGPITLRDPVGETVILRVEIETFLTISDSSITFNKIKLGEEDFIILKINQQGANTPVGLSTDDPDQFSLALSKKELHFTPDLTITPAFGGTYVQIRYAPNRSGQHIASLFVKTDYDNQTVSLQGNAGKSWWPGLWTRGNAQITQPASIRSKKLGILAILVVGGLLYAGYAYRCQLAPSLCQSQIEVNNEDSTNTLAKRTNINKKADAQSQLQPQKSESIPQLVVKTSTQKPLEVGRQIKPYRQAKLKRRILPKRKPAKGDDETELEKELNKKR